MVNRIPLLVSSVMTKALTAAVAVILVVANFTTIYAQQLTSQSGEIDNGITATPTTFQSASDGFTVQVPDGWIIQDANNTGSRLEDEIRLGYGILAQLCTKEQQGAILSNANDTINNNSTISTNGCQGAQEELIHIVRYADLDTRVVSNNITANNMTTDNILLYHLQKLQEVGYRGIQTVNRSDVTLNLTNPQTNQTIATVPAKFVEITYTTASAPDETRRGYFILTATNAIAPNLGTTKGYSVFYEGNYNFAETRSSSSSTPTPLPQAVRQVFDSFELVTVADATQTEPLTVEIISGDTEDTAPATFEFEAEITGGIEPYTIRWDFGDGSTEENDQEVEHTFDEAGSYSVGLTVTDSGDQNGSDSMEITVEEEQPLEEEEEGEDNDLVDTDEIVDDFIDDLFGRLGLR